MEFEEFSRRFLSFVCPFLLIGTPILLYGLFTAPNPPEHHLAESWLVFFGIAGVLVIFFSFRYCRNEMGWFRRKKSK
jgi:hypothetical protein